MLLNTLIFGKEKRHFDHFYHVLAASVNRILSSIDIKLFEADWEEWTSKA
jgi:hypothetical protein